MALADYQRTVRCVIFREMPLSLHQMIDKAELSSPPLFPTCASKAYRQLARDHMALILPDYSPNLVFMQTSGVNAFPNLRHVSRGL